MPKFPDITVKLIGTDGNAYAILGRVQQALRKAEVPQADIDQFMKDAMSGDYSHLLRVCMKTVNVT